MGTKFCEKLKLPPELNFLVFKICDLMAFNNQNRVILFSTLGISAIWLCISCTGVLFEAITYTEISGMQLFAKKWSVYGRTI